MHSFYFYFYFYFLFLFLFTFRCIVHVTHLFGSRGISAVYVWQNIFGTDEYELEN